MPALPSLSNLLALTEGKMRLVSSTDRQPPSALGSGCPIGSENTGKGAGQKEISWRLKWESGLVQLLDQHHCFAAAGQGDA